MVEKDFDIVLKEYFDTTDRRSMRTLLSLNEADQNQAMVALAAKLYEKIVAKVDDIDFGTIPASKGDITKIGNFQEMRECINVINEILVHYKQDTTQLEIINKAIENIKSSKKIWEKAFAIESELPMTFYNTMVLSIVSSVSLLISSSIDFIREPGHDSFEISFDRVGYTKTKDKLLFQNLDKFNKSYLKGDIEKLMGAMVKSTATIKESYGYGIDEPVTEAIAITTWATIVGIAKAIGAGSALIILLRVIVPVLHELTCSLYCAKQSISDYFEVQARIVQFNAENVKYTYTKSPEQVQKIHDKQMKIADKFKKISAAFAVKMSKADSDAKKLIEKEKSEKYKAEDLEVQDVPGMTSSIF